MWRLVAVVLLAGSVGALAQGPIQWSGDVRGSVARAQQVELPLLFRLPDPDSWRRGSGFGTKTDLEQAQDRTFRDPVVRELAETFFVPVRLANSSTNAQLLAELGTTGGYGLQCLVATPDGRLIATIRPEAVAETGTFQRRLAAAFRQYRTGFFHEQLEPVLDDAAAKPRDVRAALRRIREMLIVEADEAVAGLLERRGLGAFKGDVYDTLAALSTRRSVEVLFERALSEPRAAAALARITPAATEYLLPELKSDDDARVMLAYKTAAAVIRLPQRKGDRFFRNAAPAVRARELERLKTAVQEAAQDAAVQPISLLR